MKWFVLVAVVAATLGASAVALAASLGVQSARLTVFSNTLESPSVHISGLPLASITVGGTAQAAAVLGSPFTADAGGNVTYLLYIDDHCGTPYTPPVAPPPVTVTGAVIPPSAPVTFTAAGTYYWRAVYSGDGSNHPAQSPCAEAPLTVNKASPIISTSATVSATTGASITDTATLSGGYGTLEGTVTFTVYGPNNDFCDPPALTSGDGIVVPVGDGTYTASFTFTPAVTGSYRWIAHYSGDTDNNSVGGGCNDPNEFSTVTDPIP
jgi:hypothetical protein